MKKIISLIIVVTMVFAMGAWTYGGVTADTMEDVLQQNGFVSTELGHIWVRDRVIANSNNGTIEISHEMFFPDMNVIVYSIMVVTGDGATTTYSDIIEYVFDEFGNDIHWPN